MRKTIVIGIVAVLAIMFVSPPVSATWFGPGEYTAGGFDRSNLYLDITGDGHADALPPFFPAAVGQEQRTLFDLTAVSFGYKTVEGGLKRVNALGGTGPDYIPSSLTGMLFDIDVLGFGVNGAPIGVPGITPHTVYFGNTAGAPSRYADAASGGGTDGVWADLSPGAGGFLASTGAGFSGIIVVYDDATLNPGLFAPGAAAWLEGGIPPEPGHPSVAFPDPSITAVGGGAAFVDHYPGVSDFGALGTAVPWLVLTLIPLPNNAELELPPNNAPPGTVLIEHGFTLGIGGVGNAGGVAFANVIGGTFASQINPDQFNWPDLIPPIGAPTGPGADIRIDFEITFDATGLPTADGWQVRSDDPWQFGVIPEPASMSLLGLSLLSLIGVRIRKRK